MGALLQRVLPARAGLHRARHARTQPALEPTQRLQSSGRAVDPVVQLRRLHEGEGEGVEGLGGAEPDVQVAALGDVTAEVVGVTGARCAVDSVAPAQRVVADGARGLGIGLN